ncbi:MAG: LysR substrate-binding domain-containing protein [Bacteroidales bacterium]|nr:LysR substrate-binding domain-containing protein [Bacteroidales bacterium]
MTLQQLEYIVALDEYRHFVKAAEFCGITQSTLSTMVIKLEDELDLKLFDRDSHPMKPTVAGEKIIKQARVVLFHANQLKEMSQNEHKGVSGIIRLAIIPTIAPYIIPKLFNYIANIPNVTLRAQELQCEKILEQLKSAEIDMAIMPELPPDEKLLEIPLYKERFFAYVSPNDPLYNEKEININTMPRERLWSLKKEIYQQFNMNTTCNYESERSSLYESGNVPTLLHIIEQNAGFTIIPELHRDLIRECDLKKIRPLAEPAPTRTVSLFIRTDYVRESLLNIVVDGIKQIIPDEILDERLKKFKVKL